MLVSWNWLQEYVKLAPTISPDQFAERLMMAGLNHESTEKSGQDFVIDLEVTSNRPDCLGHLGIAREAAVLFDLPLAIPAAQLREQGPAVSGLARVTIHAKDWCPRYSARVIRGIKVGPSPAWLARRLEAVGVAVINNVVDITNYVLLECGQPLHAFDGAKLRGREIVVRAARNGEILTAIDHKQYPLDESICVIADAERPIAIAGVMGGADTEVTGATNEVLIESAEFAPRSVRSTARKLKLHSAASYRFERGVDPAGIDWASRRCCELILELAGGELASGVVYEGAAVPMRSPIILRLAQLPRILGIDVPQDRVAEILKGLGCTDSHRSATTISVTPPSWRRDLTREIDLVEEVARIHGYDQIPEDAQVPMVASFRAESDRVLTRVRKTLTSAGFDEALTISMVTPELSDLFTPWTDAPAIVADTPILETADRLRRSLIPTLLAARRFNETQQNPAAELFETAAIYLPRTGELPNEQWTVGMVSSGDFWDLKGVVESLGRELFAEMNLVAEPIALPLLDLNRSCRIMVDDQPLAYLGELSPKGYQATGLRARTAVAEINLSLLAKFARRTPQLKPLSSFPFVSRDLNLVVDETVDWRSLATTLRHAAGTLLESLDYKETYRDPAKDGAGKKRLLVSVILRSSERTLTNEEADRVRQEIVAAAAKAHGAKLLDA